MSWRKTYLREQEKIASQKGDAQLALEAAQLWKFYSQVKQFLPSKSKRRFRLMQVAVHRELKKRGILDVSFLQESDPPIVLVSLTAQ